MHPGCLLACVGVLNTGLDWVIPGLPDPAVLGRLAYASQSYSCLEFDFPCLFVWLSLS